MAARSEIYKGFCPQRYVLELHHEKHMLMPTSSNPLPRRSPRINRRLRRLRKSAYQ
jgi:hypothetical protein